jgi:hypothetical protein
MSGMGQVNTGNDIPGMAQMEHLNCPVAEYAAYG